MHRVNRILFNSPAKLGPLKPSAASLVGAHHATASSGCSSPVAASSTVGTVARIPLTATTPFNRTQTRHYSSSAGVGPTHFDTDPDAYVAGPNATQIPDFSHYRAPSTRDTATSSRAFTYFMVGTTGAMTMVGAKATVHDFLTNMSASADVLALAKVEVDLTQIPEGKNVVVKWRGKPVFIRHRTSSEIKEAESVNVAELRDPQTDAERVKQPEWLVMLGICTHLGCVPIGEAGDYDGWFCPCHGSHYDISGRIRKGPAPLNLEIPEYDIQGDKLIIG